MPAGRQNCIVKAFKSYREPTKMPIVSLFCSHLSESESENTLLIPGGEIGSFTASSRIEISHYR